MALLVATISEAQAKEKAAAKVAEATKKVVNAKVESTALRNARLDRKVKVSQVEVQAAIAASEKAEDELTDAERELKELKAKPIYRVRTEYFDKEGGAKTALKNLVLRYGIEWGYDWYKLVKPGAKPSDNEAPLAKVYRAELQVVRKHFNDTATVNTKDKGGTYVTRILNYAEALHTGKPTAKGTNEGALSVKAAAVDSLTKAWNRINKHAEFKENTKPPKAVEEANALLEKALGLLGIKASDLRTKAKL
jgi:hypothetical protein